MKKENYPILQTITAFAMFLIALPSFGQTKIFNNPGAMPTITLANNKNPCKGGPIDGCWKDSISAEKGDTISIQIYYHNTSHIISQSTTISIKPNRTSPTQIVISGGVGNELGQRTIEKAILKLNEGEVLTYINGSGIWSPTFESHIALNNEADLFGDSGLHIGQVNPNSQGIYLANFVIN